MVKKKKKVGFCMVIACKSWQYHLSYFLRVILTSHVCQGLYDAGTTHLHCVLVWHPTPNKCAAWPSLTCAHISAFLFKNITQSLCLLLLLWKQPSVVGHLMIWVMWSWALASLETTLATWTVHGGSSCPSDMVSKLTIHETNAWTKL